MILCPQDNKYNKEVKEPKNYCQTATNSRLMKSDVFCLLIYFLYLKTLNSIINNNRSPCIILSTFPTVSVLLHLE